MQLIFENKTSDGSVTQMRDLLNGMRNSFELGENVMEYARRTLGQNENLVAATQIAYDLQAGSYIRHALSDPENKNLWCSQLAGLVAKHLPYGGTLMEVGSGEATTLAGLLNLLPHKPSLALGFDISWSRCKYGLSWLNHMRQDASLFVADLFHIPLEDSSVDVVYTSHSLEPNGGRECQALQELLRVARCAVVMVEPIYELAAREARQRMEHHGYVRNLKATAESLGYKVEEYRLLDFCVNPLNPSGVVTVVKTNRVESQQHLWRCPLTHTPLSSSGTAFASSHTGLVYPVLDGIPLLCRDHAILASAYEHQISI